MRKNTIEAGFFEPAFSYIMSIVAVFIAATSLFVPNLYNTEKEDLRREYGFRPVKRKQLEKAAFVVLIFTHIFDRIHLYIKEVWANGRYDKKNK